MTTIKAESQKKRRHKVLPYGCCKTGYQTRSLFFSDRETI